MTDQSDVNSAYSFISGSYSDLVDRRSLYCDSIDTLVRECFVGDSLLDIGSADGLRINRIRHSLSLETVTCLEPCPDLFQNLSHISSLRSFLASSQEFIPSLCSSFSTVTALWNVLGHVPGEEALLASLINVRRYLRPGGVFLFDVNHRHNVSSYGLISIWRILLDSLFFKRARGDVSVNVGSSDKSILLPGHLFTQAELISILNRAGFSSVTFKFVNYDSGYVTTCPYEGQVFCVARI